MKRFTSILLVLTVLFTLASCSQEERKTEEKKGEDEITRLSAEELYTLGCEKNEGLMSAEYDTVITSGDGESVSVKTVRIREGYDSFRYSRTSPTEEVYFYDGTAYQKNADGAFTAPCSARVFREYTEEYLLPLGAFGAEALFEIEKKDLSLTYKIKNDKILSSFADLSQGFQPTALDGTCTLLEDGVLKEEEFCVTGTLGGEESSFTVKTTLSRYRSSEIEIQKPQSTEGYVALGDIRLPGMIKAAVSSLQKKETVQATFVFGNTLLASGKSYGFHQEFTAYQTVSEDKTPLGYLTRQSLKKLPDGSYESRFYQKHIASGVQKENTYDVVTATLLSEKEGTEISLPWPGEAAEFLPRLSDLKTLTMTEDSVGYSVEFTLTDAAKKALAEKALTLFPEAGVVSSGAMTFAEEKGTLLISRDLCLTAASFSVEASFAAASGEAVNFDGQYSMNVDALENVSVPSMQVPTPTTPDMVPEGAVD